MLQVKKFRRKTLYPFPAHKKRLNVERKKNTFSFVPARDLQSFSFFNFVFPPPLPSPSSLLFIFFIHSVTIPSASFVNLSTLPPPFTRARHLFFISVNSTRERGTFSVYSFFLIFWGVIALPIKLEKGYLSQFLMILRIHVHETNIMKCLKCLPQHRITNNIM